MRRALAALTVTCLALACHSSSDRRACATARDCMGIERCTGGFCGVTDGGATVDAGVLGAGCLDSSDCAAGLGCLTGALGFPSGTCAPACNTTSCPARSVCADLRDTDAGVVACMLGCGTDDDCRQGYACCTAFPGGGACLPAAYCPRTSLPASADLGDSCAVGGTSCAASETCQGGLPFPNGACTAQCVLGNAATCPANGRCIDTETGAWCLQTCTAASQCRSGYDCIPVAGVNGNVCRASAGACSGGPIDAGPPRACTLGDMPPLLVGNAGAAVGPATDPTGCQKNIVCSALPAGQVQELGIHPVGDIVRFNVPAGSASLTIVEQARSATDAVTFSGQVQDNAAVPTLLRFPDGGLVYDDNAIPADNDGGVLPKLLAFGAGGSAATGAFTLPNTSAGLQAFAAGGLPAGTWSVQVNDYALECADPATGCNDGGFAGNTYDVQVLTKPGPLPASGVVDVNFYLIDTAGLTAQSATTNSAVQRMVKTLSTLYKNAGICLGNVTFFNVPSWAQQKYATLDVTNTLPCDDLSQMFTLSVPGNALNFFLVQSLADKTNNSGGTIVGIDGTIPGPSSIGGSVHSGAAVSIADLSLAGCGASISVNCGADSVAFIAAHEGGHWLGLIHPSEQGGDQFDLLSDTPVCKCEAACVGSTRAAKCGQAGGASPTVVNAADCLKSSTDCQGGDNLMFWLLQDGASLGHLTSEQGQVMRANPVVR